MKTYSFLLLVILIFLTTACQPPAAQGVKSSISSIIDPSPSSIANISVSSTPITTPTSLPTSTPQPAPTLARTIPMLELETIPSFTPTSTSVPISHCLDEQARPLKVPNRSEPLEVHWISTGNIWAWQEAEGVAHQISNTGDARNFYFSPDGQSVAFTRRVDLDGIRLELWAVDRGGSSLRQLISVEQFDSLWTERHEAWVANQPTNILWLPDSQKLTFSIYPYVNAVGDCDTSIGSWLVDVGTGSLTELTSPKAASGSQDWVLPSPDGKWNALVLSDSLSLERADKSLRRESILTYPAISVGEGCGTDRPHIKWASDSQSLVAIVEDESFYWGSGTFSTWRVPVDGSPAQRLATFSGSFLNIALSSDQKYLSYWKPEKPMSNIREIHLATIDGRQDILYASGEALFFQGWSPDSYHFIFGSTTTRQAFYGSLCSSPTSLLGAPETPVENVTWIDAAHFLFVTGREEEPHQLHLGQVGGESVLLGPFEGEGAYYEISGEE